MELNAGNLDTEQQDDEGILDVEQLEDEDCVQVDASVVDNLRRKWKKKTKHEENDETLWQYVRDNEGPAMSTSRVKPFPYFLLLFNLL